MGRDPIPMTQRSELPGGLPSHFRVSDARSSGVSRRRLEAADLSAPFTGMRGPAAGAPVADRYEQQARDLRRLAAAYLAIAPERFAFSHVTAARLYGMPLPAGVAARPGLDVVVPGRAVRRAGVRGHKTLVLDARWRDGMPMLHPELVWLQLAAVLHPDDLVVAGDYLVRRKRALSSLERLREAVEGFAGQRGCRAATAALARLRAGTDSPPESRLRILLIAAGLPEPFIGYQVHDNGYWVGTPDLAYPQHKVAIEYQGGGHRDEDVFEDDIARLERFHDAGWTVIQITKGQLRTPATVVDRVRRALAEGSNRR